MKCKNCNKRIVIVNPQTRNIKFCSVYCRNKWRWENGGRDKDSRIKDLAALFPAKNKIQCKICGRWYVQVLTHVYEKHGILGREYKKEFGYDVKKGLIPDHYRKIKRDCQDPKTLKNLKKGKKFWFVRGDKKAGRYKRSVQTLKRLKELGSFKKLKTK